MNYKLRFIGLFGMMVPLALGAQCMLNATLEGDPILCPNETSTLHTQDFDSYQWYRFPWGGQAEIIPGATASSIVVSEADIWYTYYVEVTQDTCTGFSDSLVIDQWVFIGPDFSLGGKFSFNQNTGNFEVCEGDTLFLEAFPFEVNIIWYKDGSPIIGEHMHTLAITESGSYSIVGAPSVCPNYLDSFAMYNPVLVVECPTSIEVSSKPFSLSIYPNPANDLIQVTMPSGAGPGNFVMSNSLGQVVWQSGMVEEANIYTLHPKITGPGSYWLRWQGSDGRQTSIMVGFQSR